MYAGICIAEQCRNRTFYEAVKIVPNLNECVLHDLFVSLK